MSDTSSALSSSLTHTAVAGFIGFVLLGAIAPKKAAQTPHEMGRRWLGWSVFYSCLTLLGDAIFKGDADSNAKFFIILVAYGVSAYLLGWLYGRFYKLRTSSGASIPDDKKNEAQCPTYILLDRDAEPPVIEITTQSNGKNNNDLIDIIPTAWGKVFFITFVQIIFMFAFFSIFIEEIKHPNTQKHEIHSTVNTANSASDKESDALPNDLPSIKKLAALGSSKAQGWLGVLYHDGQGVPKDLGKAAKWFRKAAEQGNAVAQHYLASLYYQGKGVPQDFAEAAKWYRKAAEQGNAVAQLYLASLYYQGKGVPQDFAEAAKWHRKAADQGLSIAQALLGCLYVDGDGVPQDYAEGYFWLNLAVASSNGDLNLRARKIRDSASKKLTPQQIADTQRRAREWSPKVENK
jgi:hypothetical protein